VLGDQLAERIDAFRNNDSIIVCLDKNALAACIEMATVLHTWIFVIYYEPISDPYARGRILGALIETGNFVLNPEISPTEYEYIYSEFSSHIEEKKREAMSILNRSKQINSIDRTFINGRNILLTDDIFRDEMGMAIAKALLKPLSPAHIEGAAGNIMSEMSTKLYLETQGATYIDVLPADIFDDDHYFEEQDTYTEEERLAMAQNIANYWH
jgi:predicted phosphoribosyltransferase